jgi:pimeloyl-ACP methyl ester carboxylesterase
MEPQVRYVRTGDGVKIAFSTLGAGPPLLLSPQGMICDMVALFRVPQYSRWIELLAGRYTVILYDYRGWGSSQRDVTDISLETMLLDLDAVIGATSFERVAVFGSMINAAIACAHAARSPEHVSHLILWSAGWGGPPGDSWKWADSLEQIARVDWSAYARLRIQAQWGWAEPEQARAYAKILRDSTSADTYLATVEAWKTIEIQHLLDHACRPQRVSVRAQPRWPATACDRHTGRAHGDRPQPGLRSLAERGRNH